MSNIQTVSYGFLQTYYQRMNEDPTKLSNLYGKTAELTHLNYQHIDLSVPLAHGAATTVKLTGKENINKFFTRNEEKVRNLKVKLDSCDFQTTGFSHKGILIITTGEMFWTGYPVQRFCQTFILSPTGLSPDIYDISNDVIRFIAPDVMPIVEKDVPVEVAAKQTTKAKKVSSEERSSSKKSSSKEKSHKEHTPKSDTSKEHTPKEEPVKERTPKEHTPKEVTSAKSTDEAAVPPAEPARKEPKKSSKSKKESVTKETTKTAAAAPAVVEKTEVADVVVPEVKTTSVSEAKQETNAEKTETPAPTEQDNTDIVTPPVVEKSEKSEKPEKSEKSEKSGKPETPEKSEQNEKAEKTTTYPVESEKATSTVTSETESATAAVETPVSTSVAIATESAPTPAPAPVKMSWASKISLNDGVNKESKKIYIPREEVMTTTSTAPLARSESNRNHKNARNNANGGANTNTNVNTNAND